MARPLRIALAAATGYAAQLPAAPSGHAIGFAAPGVGASVQPARAPWSPRQRVARRGGGLTEGRSAKRQLKPAKKVALTLGEPDSSRERLVALLGLAARGLLLAAGAAGVLVVLLYITSFFESIMHGTAGRLSGSSPLLAGAAGVAIGALHTVAGPDHLAGLAPLVVGQRRSPLAAFGLGALWGSGHATGQLIIGMAFLMVHLGLLCMSWAPALGQASGFLVGISLVAIGLLGFHEADDHKEGIPAAGQAAPRKRRFGWATYATGVLHGLSPDAVMFLLPALALPRLAATTHVLGVAMGTLVSMGACTALLGALCSRSPRLKLISTTASSVAVLLGACVLAASMGVSVPLPGH